MLTTSSCMRHHSKMDKLQFVVSFDFGTIGLSKIHFSVFASPSITEKYCSCSIAGGTFDKNHNDIFVLYLCPGLNERSNSLHGNKLETRHYTFLVSKKQGLLKS